MIYDVNLSVNIVSCIENIKKFAETFQLTTMQQKLSYTKLRILILCMSTAAFVCKT